MSNVKWTEEQLQAINEKGNNILVAAAAGSGKTAVLVERIINKVINENIDIEPFNEDAYREALSWAQHKVEEISGADEFYPNREFFSCYYLCGLSNHCCYDLAARAERRNRA